VHRQSLHVNCQFVNRRLLSLATLGRQDIPDVIGLFVRTTSGPVTEQPFDRTFTPSMDNHALILRELNSYWPVAAGCFGLGVAFALLGGIAIFKD